MAVPVSPAAAFALRAVFVPVRADIFTREAHKNLLHIAGKAAVDALQSSWSYWPVDTGASKAGWYYDVIGDYTINILNTQYYAEFVEYRTGAAYETIEEDLAFDEALEKIDDYSLRLLDREIDIFAGYVGTSGLEDYF